jgi:hypothetical protein
VGVAAGAGVTAADVALGVVAQPTAVIVETVQSTAASERTMGRVIGIDRLELVTNYALSATDARPNRRRALVKDAHGDSRLAHEKRGTMYERADRDRASRNGTDLEGENDGARKPDEHRAE